MTQEEIEKVKELHQLVTGSKHFVFSCYMCTMWARTADCKGCPVYGAGE